MLDLASLRSVKYGLSQKYCVPLIKLPDCGKHKEIKETYEILVSLRCQISSYTIKQNITRPLINYYN